MGKNYESFDKGFVFNTPFELAKFLFTQTHILPRDIHIHLQVESLHAWDEGPRPQLNLLYR